MTVDERELNRLKALNRANIMSKCFNEDVFDDFVLAMNAKYVKGASAEKLWDTACRKVKLTDEQQRWLENYLKNYNKELAWNESPPPNGW